MVAGIPNSKSRRADSRLGAATAGKNRKKSTNAGMVKHRKGSLNMTMDSLLNSNLVNHTLLVGNTNEDDKVANRSDDEDELLINDLQIHGTSDAEIDGLNLLRHSKSLLPAEFTHNKGNTNDLVPHSTPSSTKNGANGNNSAIAESPVFNRRGTDMSNAYQEGDSSSLQLLTSILPGLDETSKMHETSGILPAQDAPIP